MPIFEYRCRECGENFEAIVKSSEVRVACKSCGGRKVEKKLSVFAVSTSSAPTASATPAKSGPCGCGSPRRGVCGM